MLTPPKAFVWYELMTTDLDGAKAFYAAVNGWEAQEWGEAEGRYVIMSASEKMVAGGLPLPAEVRAAGGRPRWVGYIGVDDVDTETEAVSQAGGTVHRAPADIPEVGRFAVVADPQGAVFILFKPSGADNSPAPAGTPGHVGWHELYAATGRAPWTSTQPGSAGRRRTPSTWVPWAPTSCSQPVASRSVA
jgi:uncharacterized protein